LPFYLYQLILSLQD
jgi:hypothetical protein